MGSGEGGRGPLFHAARRNDLARVEHYFSDWLACTESRRYRPDGTMIQQPVPLHRAAEPMKTALRTPDGTIETVDVPASLALPTNLIVAGTVNVDETTYGFSQRVLDRAMVLEFDEVDLERLRNGGGDHGATDGYRFPNACPRSAWHRPRTIRSSPRQATRTLSRSTKYCSAHTCSWATARRMRSRCSWRFTGIYWRLMPARPAGSRRWMRGGAAEGPAAVTGEPGKTGAASSAVVRLFPGSRGSERRYRPGGIRCGRFGAIAQSLPPGRRNAERVERLRFVSFFK